MIADTEDCDRAACALGFGAAAGLTKFEVKF